MTEVLIGLIILFVTLVLWIAYGLFNSRLEDKEKELDEFSGVYDVRRKAEDSLNNDDEYRERVRRTFNDESG